MLFIANDIGWFGTLYLSASAAQHAMDTNTPSPRSTAPNFHLVKVLTLSVCHFIHDAYSSFLAPLLPLLIEKLSMSLTQAGFLTTVMQIPALMNPYLGALADKSSVRYFIIVAPGVTAITMSLIGVAPGYFWLVLLLFVSGISAALFHVPAPVLIYRFAGQRKGLGMSFFMTGGELARTVGPLVAIGAVSLLGLEGIYPLMTVGIGASILLYFRLHHTPVPSRNGNPPPSMKAAWRGTRHVLLPLSGILIFRGFMHASGATFLPTFINQNTGSLWLAGISLTVYEAAGVIGALTIGSLSDRFGRRNLLLFSLLSAPPFLFFFLLASSIWGQLLALFGFGFTLLSTTPVMLAMVQEHAQDSPATANGFFMMLSFLARSAVVVAVGAIADVIGLNQTYMLSAGLGLFAIPIVFTLPKQEK